AGVSRAPALRRGRGCSACMPRRWRSARATSPGTGSPGPRWAQHGARPASMPSQGTGGRPARQHPARSAVAADPVRVAADVGAVALILDPRQHLLLDLLLKLGLLDHVRVILAQRIRRSDE